MDSTEVIRPVDTFFLFTDPGFNLTATTMITGILEDNQKNLWVASSAGIFKFNPKRMILLFITSVKAWTLQAIIVLMRGIKGRRGELFFGDRTGYMPFFRSIKEQFEAATNYYR
jgi:ligand-binding sensor domain-containing protein